MAVTVTVTVTVTGLVVVVVVVVVIVSTVTVTLAGQGIVAVGGIVQGRGIVVLRGRRGKDTGGAFSGCREPRRVVTIRRPFGESHSLVVHKLWVLDVGGSNPPSPTN